MSFIEYMVSAGGSLLSIVILSKSSESIGELAELKSRVKVVTSPDSWEIETPVAGVSSKFDPVSLTIISEVLPTKLSGFVSPLL